MNDRVDSCGQRNERAASNILPDAGARLDRGNATRREAGGLALHREGTRAGTKSGGAIGENTEREKLGLIRRALAEISAEAGTARGKVRRLIFRAFLRECGPAWRIGPVNTMRGDCVRSGKLFAM